MKGAAWRSSTTPTRTERNVPLILWNVPLILWHMAEARHAFQLLFERRDARTCCTERSHVGSVSASRPKYALHDRLRLANGVCASWLHMDRMVAGFLAYFEEWFESYALLYFGDTLH